MKTFNVLKEIRVGDKTYYPGETVEETKDRDWGAIQRMGLVAKGDNKTEAKVGERAPESFTPKAIKEKPKEHAPETKEALTNQDDYVNDKPVIKQAGPAWMKVYLGDEVLGKAVRTREEAQEIIDEWQKENK